MIFMPEIANDDEEYREYIEHGWSYLVFRRKGDAAPFARFYGCRIGDLGLYPHFDLLDGDHTAQDVAAAIRIGMRSMEKCQAPMIITKVLDYPGTVRLRRILLSLGFHEMQEKYRGEEGQWVMLCKNNTDSL